MRIRWLLGCGLVLGAFTTPAAAQGWNDPACRSASRPTPAVLVHGRGGNVHEMTAVRQALIADGRCVFGANYGHERPGGAAGLARLDASGAEVDGYIDQVMGWTGAAQVDLVAHSAGGGVVDNIILLRGSAWKVHRAVIYGGLHHPYAHVGLADFADVSLFLPNLTVTARRLIPGIDVQTVARTALDIYRGATGDPLEGTLGGFIDADTVESGFVADLFEPEYWRRIHGALSEPDGTYIVPRSTRTLHTADSHRSVCYTNIVGLGDLITGAAAGFQDEATNVDNFILPTPSDHVGILSDPLALAKMLADLGSPCAPSLDDPPPPGTPMDMPDLRPEPEDDLDGGAGELRDAGVAVADASVPDGGSPFEDAITAGQDMSPSRPPGPNPGLSSGGCGCRTATSGEPQFGAILLLCGLIWRRRIG